MGEAITVLVVDGHQTFAELLGVALAGQPDLRYVGHARTGEQAIRLVLRPSAAGADPGRRRTSSAPSTVAIPSSAPSRPSTTSGWGPPPGASWTARSAPEGPPPRRRGKRATALAGTDKLVLGLMLGIPTFVHVLFVWIPALGSIGLSFSKWNGIGGFEDIEWIGVENYVEIFTEYPRFWPAVQHNLIWLGFLFIFPTILGMLLAVVLDREMKGSRFYQTAFYMPVVLSPALIGFIWQLFYSRDQGLINQVFGSQVDWYGDPDINLWAVLLATAWRPNGEKPTRTIRAGRSPRAAWRSCAMKRRGWRRWRSPSI